MADSERKPLGANYWQQLAGRGRDTVSEEIRSRLICPDDDAPLEFQEKLERYVCTGCARLYKETDGFLSVLPSAEPYQLSPAEQTEVALTAAEENRVEDPKDLYHALWERMAERAGNLKGKLVLDLCCGTGWAAAWFAKEGAYVAAADITVGVGGLQSAAELRRREAVRVDLFQADVVRLPFARHCFDIVFVSRALHRMRRPERMSKEIGRVLRPGGRLFNLGEPLGNPAATERDQRHAGGGLSKSDYKGIFAEGGILLHSVFADDHVGQEPSLTARLRHGYRARFTTEERLLAGQIAPDFQLPKLRRKEGPTDG